MVARRAVQRWIGLAPEDEQQERLVAGELLPKISVWDSETGLARRYCLPETGRLDYGGARFTWSPDNRYLAFTIQLPVEGDFFPTPTTTPDIPIPTSTPIPLETQYQYQFPRTVVLDTQTGYITVLNQEIPCLSGPTTRVSNKSRLLIRRSGDMAQRLRRGRPTRGRPTPDRSMSRPRTSVRSHGQGRV
jgi:hypothetical protein